MRWAGHIACTGETKHVYIYIQDFGGESEGKRQLGRLGHRWEGNIKMDY